MLPILRKDPIIEAVCEFRLDTTDWDWTIPGVVYARLKDRFPRKAEAKHIDFQIEETPEGVHPSAQQSIGRMQFWNTSNSQLVQVGPSLLTVHQLPPYTGWPDFKILIEDVLADYEAAAPFNSIVAMSLRYINRLPFPLERMKIEEMLRVLPQIPDSEGQKWRSWFQQVEIVQEQHSALLAVRSGYLPQAPLVSSSQSSDSPHMMLDLLFSHFTPHGPQPIAREDVSDWLETAHSEIETLFFNSLQVDYLQLFEPEVKHENETDTGLA